jgi:hypothetical protein
MTFTSVGHVTAHLYPQPASGPHFRVFSTEMPASVHSDDREEQAEGPEDGYWPALEILNERKHEYLVNWDGKDPETGQPWSPSWTRKTEVTEDLIGAWEVKKAAKKKNNRRGVLGSARFGD